MDVDVNTPLGHDSINLHWNGVHTGLDGSYGPESSDNPSFVPFGMALKDVMYTDTCVSTE